MNDEMEHTGDGRGDGHIEKIDQKTERYVKELLAEKQILDPSSHAVRLIQAEIEKALESGRLPQGARFYDVYHERATKITARVLVPQKEHPRFNFVGKLLGPKGSTFKRLQDETQCRMSILGRGSMKDKNKEEELRQSGDLTFAHLSDMLHVEVNALSSPAEAHARMAYALAELRKYLIPDSNDDIGIEQQRLLGFTKDDDGNILIGDDMVIVSKGGMNGRGRGRGAPRGAPRGMPRGAPRGFSRGGFPPARGAPRGRGGYGQPRASLEEYTSPRGGGASRGSSEGGFRGGYRGSTRGAPRGMGRGAPQSAAPRRARAEEAEEEEEYFEDNSKYSRGQESGGARYGGGGAYAAVDAQEDFTPRTQNDDSAYVSSAGATYGGYHSMDGDEDFQRRGPSSNYSTAQSSGGYAMADQEESTTSWKQRGGVSRYSERAAPYSRRT